MHDKNKVKNLTFLYDAEDLLQNTLEKMWEKRETFDGYRKHIKLLAIRLKNSVCAKKQHVTKHTQT